MIALIGNGIELQYEMFGNIEHESILLVSGAGAPAKFWPDAFCLRLASAGYHVLRYCHRDTGLSTHFESKYTCQALVNDLIQLSDLLKIEKFHVVGHSMGGYIAQLLCIQRPDMLVSATSISAGPSVDPQVIEELSLGTMNADTWKRLTENCPTGDFEQDLPSWLDTA